MSTSAGSRLPYMVFVVAKVIDPKPFNACGPSEEPLCHDGRVRQEVKGLCECPEALGIFQMDLKIFANFDHWLKRITCWCVISLTWCRIMAVHKCCTFRLKRKNLLSPTPDACCALLALRSIQLMTGEPRPPVQRAPVTWREWGLWE